MLNLKYKLNITGPVSPIVINVLVKVNIGMYEALPVGTAHIANTSDTKYKGEDEGQLRKIKKVGKLGRPIVKNKKRDRPRQLFKKPQRNNITRVKKTKTRKNDRAVGGKNVTDFILTI